MKQLWASSVFVVLFLAGPAQAQTINQIEALHFGTFAVVDNTAPRAITVTPSNNTVADPEIVIGEDGQRGEYLFEGLPNNVQFYIGVTVPNPPTEGGVTLDNASQATGGGGFFTIDTFDIGNGGVLQSNGIGEAPLDIGATLRTSGDGSSYTGGAYSGSYDITIYY